MRRQKVNALRLILVVALAAALAGCESAPIKKLKEDISNLMQPEKVDGKQDLVTGLRRYDEGKYGESARSLQAALDGGLDEDDQITAHKYLAFIHCVSGREPQCRNEFRKALAIDPAFELEPAEAGHPIWGPVFRSAKGRR
jgi:Tfp pilus assembly protein PilF